MVREVVTDGRAVLRAYGGGSVVLLAWNVVDDEQRSRLRGFTVTRRNTTTGAETACTPEGLVARWHWSDYTPAFGVPYLYTVQGFGADPQQALFTLALTITLPDPFTLTHGVFFNRGVAGSQAYERRFPNAPPLSELTRRDAPERWEWLSRGLEEALVRFVQQAVDGADALHVAAYELTYEPFLELLKSKIAAGVRVTVIFDAKETGKGKKENTVEAEAALAVTGFPVDCIIRRRANPSAISHNKFIVWSRNAVPLAVWTGSTNFTVGGIFGQANVGHIVRVEAVARAYLGYWNALASDPASKSLRPQCEALSPLPASLEPDCCLPFFAPRTSEQLLHFHATLLDLTSTCSLLTAAFGVHPLLEAVMLRNRTGAPRFVLSESKKGLGRLAGDNVHTAFGAVLASPVKGKVAEKTTGLNDHVQFVHTKVMVIDAFSDDPIVITGSGNFSKASVVNNDENQLVIRGDVAAADAYTLEFWRLFSHHLFRSRVQDGVAAHDWLHDDAMRHLLCPLAVPEAGRVRAVLNVNVPAFLADATAWIDAQPTATMGTIQRTRNGEYRLQSGYNKKLVDDIKALPAAQRRWDAAASVWIIHGDARDVLEKMAVKHRLAMSEEADEEE